MRVEDGHDLASLREKTENAAQLGSQVEAERIGSRAQAEQSALGSGSSVKRGGEGREMETSFSSHPDTRMAAGEWQEHQPEGRQREVGRKSGCRLKVEFFFLMISKPSSITFRFANIT